MQLGRPVQREFNNLQMTTAEFIVLNDQRALRGIAAFVSHRGRTYQMIGYADRTRYGRFAQELMNIVQSFAPVSDPEILSVEPQRIDVVRVDRSQTLAQFAERYRSASASGRHVTDRSGHADQARRVVSRLQPTPGCLDPVISE